MKGVVRKLELLFWMWISVIAVSYSLIMTMYSLSLSLSLLLSHKALSQKRQTYLHPVLSVLHMTFHTVTE